MQDGSSGEQLKRFYGCYLLRTLAEKKYLRGRTYVGFTADPARRVRQHNGEIQGGAWQTSRFRPWTMLLFVSGFTSKRQALQFEWAWQNPLRTTVLSDVTRKKSWFSGTMGRVRALGMLLSTDSRSWATLKLTVTVLDRSVLPVVSKMLPDHIKVIPSTWEELDLKALEVGVVVEPTFLTCRMCDEPDDPDGDFSFIECHKCSAALHRDCLRDAKRTKPNVPLLCPACSEELQALTITPHRQRDSVDVPQSSEEETSECDLCSDSEDGVSVDLRSPSCEYPVGFRTPEQESACQSTSRTPSPSILRSGSTVDLCSETSTGGHTVDLTLGSPPHGLTVQITDNRNGPESSSGCLISMSSGTLDSNIPSFIDLTKSVKQGPRKPDRPYLSSNNKMPLQETLLGALKVKYPSPIPKFENLNTAVTGTTSPPPDGFKSFRRVKARRNLGK